MKACVCGGLVFITVAAVADAVVLYQSANLQGHQLSAECNPGGTSAFSCDDNDVALTIHSTYGEVTSNPLLHRTYVNAIGFRPFYETFTNGYPIGLTTLTYTVEVRLPVLPEPNVTQVQNPQAVHIMVQLWDGRNALWAANKHTLEATIYWDLNPWTPDYGKIKIYTGVSLTPTDTGIALKPDTLWHTLQVTADFQRQQYVAIQVDGSAKNLPGTVLAQRDHSVDPGWATDTSVKLSLTTESMAAFPSDPGDHFSWTTQFRNVALMSADIRPTLGLKRSGDALVLSWPASTGRWAAERTSGFGPARWIRLSLDPVLNVGEETVTVDAPATAGFFRLVGP